MLLCIIQKHCSLKKKNNIKRFFKNRRFKKEIIIIIIIKIKGIIIINYRYYIENNIFKNNAAK